MKSGGSLISPPISKLRVAPSSLINLLRRSRLPQKNTATATRNTADMPDAMETPMTAGELSVDELETADGVVVGLVVVATIVMVVAAIVVIVGVGVTVAVSVAAVAAAVAVVLVDITVGVCVDGNNVLPWLFVLVAMTLLGMVDWSVLLIGVSVPEAVSFTTDTFVAVITPWVSGSAPGTSSHIAYPTGPSLETTSDGHEPTMQANAASPRVRPLIVFDRQRQVRSFAEQQDPARVEYSVLMNCCTQDWAHVGTEALRNVLLPPLPVAEVHSVSVAVVEAEDMMLPNPSKTTNASWKTLLLHRKHKPRILSKKILVSAPRYALQLVFLIRLHTCAIEHGSGGIYPD